MTRIRVTMAFRITLTLILSFTAVAAFAQVQSPLDVAHKLGMSKAAIERVKNSEIVVEDLEATSDKDLSIAIVARVDAPLQEIYVFLQSDRLIQLSSVTVSAGDIDTATFSMDAMTLPDDVLQLLVDEPEDTFYMSKDELALIKKASADGKARVLETYRGVLSARARAYWEEGVAGIEPYAGKDRSPRIDLDNANAAAKKLILNASVLSELDVIPSHHSGSAKHRLTWAVQKGRDRAAPILSHRIVYAENDGEVSIERRFYSGYDYDSLQIVTGILPVSENACVAFYLNHTYTSQVAGFGGGAKRAIGRRLMQKELVAEIERARTAIRDK
jgi:hypothetical protein